MKILRNAVLRKLHLIVMPVIFGCLYLGSFQIAHGQTTTTFAQFFEDDGSQDYSFVNNTSSASFNTVSGGSGIFFIYQNISGLDAALQGPQQATLTMTSSTATAAALNGTDLDQSLNQTITIAIIRNTAAPVGVGLGSRRNLLTATITTNTASPTLTGGNGAGSASFSATTPNQTVVFTSDFLNFAVTTQRNMGLSFSSVSPVLAVGAGNFLRNFTAAGSGTFASNPVPTIVGPTAATATISGRVLTSDGRGLRNAQVTVTQADGSTRTILTNGDGRYSFADLTVPQTVIVSVISKRHIYNPQVISFDSDFSEVTFTPNTDKYSGK